jgi:hypothetical protein
MSYSTFEGRPSGSFLQAVEQAYLYKDSNKSET